MYTNLLPDVSLRCFVARQLFSQIYALSSVKFLGLKFQLCKKRDKYEVWTPSLRVWWTRNGLKRSLEEYQNLSVTWVLAMWNWKLLNYFKIYTDHVKEEWCLTGNSETMLNGHDKFWNELFHVMKMYHERGMIFTDQWPHIPPPPLPLCPACWFVADG